MHSLFTGSRETVGTITLVPARRESSEPSREKEKDGGRVEKERKREIREPIDQ